MKNHLKVDNFPPILCYYILYSIPWSVGTVLWSGIDCIVQGVGHIKYIYLLQTNVISK